MSSTAGTPDPSPLSATMYPDSTTSALTSSAGTKKTTATDPKRYSCQFCSRAFSRSEHRSRHERSHTKERPFKCLKCRSTFVRRDLLLRHDRTVHAKDGGVPLQTAEPKRRSNNASAPSSTKPSPLAESTNSSLSGHDYQHDHFESPSSHSNNNAYLGLEEAAMLMTNFQQKAAMNPSPIDTSQSSAPQSAYSPSLPHHRQWEPLAALAPARGLDNHLSSADTRSALPYPNGNNSNPHQASAVSASAHVIDPAISAASRYPTQPTTADVKPVTARASGLATPESFSPHPPYLTGPSSPIDGRSGPRPPQIHDKGQIARALDEIERCRDEGSLPDSFQLPEVAILNRYISAFFTYFYPHMPFLHLPTFDLSQVCAPLLLSVISIGALYTFEQDHSYMLHIGSKILVNKYLTEVADFSSRKSPLWAMQATLLNMMFASWSGDIRGLEWCCSIKSLVANMVAGNRYELKLRTQARAGHPSHREWIEDEECRRTYFGVYVFYGLLTLTFNHTPAISFNEFDVLELPSAESVWSLPPGDEGLWRERLSASHRPTFKVAHHSLFQGETVRYSVYAARIMVNSLFLEVWYHKRSPEALQDMVTEYKLRLALDTWHKSIDLCDNDGPVNLLTTPNRAHPLVFNAMAMYRNTNVRLVVDLMAVQEALRYHDSGEVASAMMTAREYVKRSDETLKAIQACIDCIEVAAAQGIRWFARTSATNWSPEHPLCGLDLVLLLSHWLWRVEHDEQPPSNQEKALYEKVQNLFDDDTKGAYPRELGSTVARLWGSMIDEVVVWGITKLMGESFKYHAQALSDSEATAHALSSMASMREDQGMST